MTSKPMQPLAPRDGALPQIGGVSASQRQTSQQPRSDSPQDASQGAAGAGTLRSSPQAPAASAVRVGSSAEVLGYLNRISELAGKARKALSASIPADMRQASERQADEGGARPSPSEDGESSSERAPGAPSPLRATGALAGDEAHHQ